MISGSECDLMETYLENGIQQTAIGGWWGQNSLSYCIFLRVVCIMICIVNVLGSAVVMNPFKFC